jgi:hypothetical protein
MKMPWESLIDNISSLAGEFIEDKDKRNDLMFKVKELEFSLRETLLATKTNPYVDGFVKVLIAFRDIILPMMRPLGAFYLSYMGVDIAQAELAAGDDISALSGGLTAAFPAWGASRHANKKHEETEKTKRHKKEEQDPFWFDQG